MPTGIDRIAAERTRQVSDEGYTAEHDRDHAADLSAAAMCYTSEANAVMRGVPPSPRGVAPSADDDLGITNWPWHPSYWKPTGDPIHDLTKAGALIAAAIDSLQEG